MGNFSGKPARALVGVEAAAPVAARILEQLYAGRTTTWYPVPDSVARRKVCAVSGMPAKEICAARTTDYCIRGVSSDQPCSVHEKIKEKIVEVWPVELAAWFKHQGRQWAEKTPVPFFAAKPKIISPPPKQTYVLAPFQQVGTGQADAGAASQNVLLKAASRGDKVYWFVDNTLYRACSAQDQTFWPLQPGTHKIVCADDSGRSASVVINVQ
jgi:penicillin-binding protein 1C